MIFTKQDYDKLATLFNSDYAGYKPEVKELPNGDGKVDEGKRYLHIALKYDPPIWAVKYLAQAHFEACRIAELEKVPDEFYPRVENATLRVLDYPMNCGTEPHTDFDLLTVNCYQSGPGLEYKFDDGSWQETWYESDYHIGELGEIVGLGNAEAHRVRSTPFTRQSIVYFAMPSNDAVLEEYGFGYDEHAVPYPRGRGLTVGDWLKERYARSRTYK